MTTKKEDKKTKPENLNKVKEISKTDTQKVASLLKRWVNKK